MLIESMTNTDTMHFFSGVFMWEYNARSVLSDLLVFLVFFSMVGKKKTSLQGKEKAYREGVSPRYDVISCTPTTLKEFSSRATSGIGHVDVDDVYLALRRGGLGGLGGDEISIIAFRRREGFASGRRIHFSD